MGVAQRDIHQKIKDHEVIAEFEASAVNTFFEKSEILALAYLNDAIKSFTQMLIAEKGPLVPAMDVEYRTFIIKLIEFIKEEHKESVISEILRPVHNVSFDALFSLEQSEKSESH